jgi:hypothetical protein
MPNWGERFEASQSESTLLVLFIPSVDRNLVPIDQHLWVGKALAVLGSCFRGATAFPQGRGVWRDDAQGGKLIFDEPTVIQCYTNEQVLEREAAALRAFLVELGTQTNQGAVGFVIDRDYLEIRFPLRESNHGEEHRETG